MNSFGRLFRVHIFGESHGKVVGINIDGCPPGIPIHSDDFVKDLDRRRAGDKGTTSRKEDDIPLIQSGVFNGFTTGAPINIVFNNKDTQSQDYEEIRKFPRPGHADFVASKKFNGFEDYRGGGHFSGRLTVCLVAAGVIAKKVLSHHFINHKIEINSKLISVAGNCDIEKGIQLAVEANDSVGGIVECVVDGLPVGLGEPFFDSVESLLSHAVFSIPAVRGIEFGLGFAAAKMFGSDHNDAFIDSQGRTKTNNSGGISGGLTNGNQLIYRIAVKPTSSTPQKQDSLNMKNDKIESFIVKGRHDLCIALRIPPVLESITAMVIADQLLI